MNTVVIPSIWMGRPFEVDIWKLDETTLRLQHVVIPKCRDLTDRIYKLVKASWPQIQDSGYMLRIRKQDMETPCLVLEKQDPDQRGCLKIYKPGRMSLQRVDIEDVHGIMKHVQMNLDYALNRK